MITLDDIKKRLKVLPYTIKENIKKKALTWVVDDSLKTWVGELYQCTKQEDGTWQEVLIGRNSVLLSGLQNLAYLLYHIPPKVKIPYFEDMMWGVSDINEKNLCTYDKDTMPFVQGYNLAKDGVSGGVDLRPYPRHKNGYDFDQLIPFRVIPVSENDFALYRNKYLHHRYITIGGIQYVAYYTKKCAISYQALLDNSSPIPDNPNDNLVTDRDSRVVAEFTLNIEDEELVEWFRLTQDGGAEGTNFSATILMIGKAGKWHPKDKPEELYDTVMECQVMSRAQHSPIPSNLDSSIVVKYKLMHI